MRGRQLQTCAVTESRSRRQLPYSWIRPRSRSRIPITQTTKIGRSQSEFRIKVASSSWRFARAGIGFGSSVGGRLLARRKDNMQKASAESANEELRPEYDLTQLRGGVRGKYYRRAKAGTNLVLIDPDLAKTFPDEASVNRALRLLVSTARAATRKVQQHRRDTRSRDRGSAAARAAWNGAKRNADR